MKVAVVSDIHGFSIAFDRVLEDIASEPDIDHLVIAGDLCEGGPDPKGVLGRIATLDAVVIQGNTDRDIGNQDRSSDGARYTISQIGDDGLRYLRNLPFLERISPPGGRGQDDDLLVVHANPVDQDRHLAPDAGPQELRELLDETQAAVIAFGHLHIAYIRELENMTLIDISAVGNPKDGDPRSKWGLIEWDETSRTWAPTLRYVEYPIEETEAQMLQSDMPNALKQVKKLRRASYE